MAKLPSSRMMDRAERQRQEVSSFYLTFRLTNLLACVTVGACGGLRAAFRTQLSPYAMWTPRIESEP